MSQEEYNKEHGITPETIKKAVSGGVIETLRGNKKRTKTKKVDVTFNKEEIDKRIKTLKEEMKIAAKDLRFEDAAKIRDEIKELTESRLLL